MWWGKRKNLTPNAPRWDENTEKWYAILALQTEGKGMWEKRKKKRFNAEFTEVKRIHRIVVHDSFFSDRMIGDVEAWE